MPDDREYWLTSIWSARKRPDGSLEPYYRISGEGIGPQQDSDIVTPAAQRHILESFGKIKPGDPFFTIEAKFTLIRGG